MEDRTLTRAARRELWVAGLLATGLSLVGSWLVGRVYRGVPFAPTAVAEAVVRASPGGLATFFIESMGHWATRLLGLGASIGALFFGAEVFVRTARPDGPRSYLSGAVLALVAAAGIVVGPMDNESPAGMVVVLGVTAVIFGASANGFFRALRLEGSMDESRRRVLRIGVTGAVGIAAVGGLLGWFAKRFGGPDRDVVLVAPTRPATVPARPGFPDIPGLTPEVTSVADHYVVDINLVPPAVEADGWELEVFGLVDAPMALDFASLQNRFQVIEEHSVLTCISNEVGGSLVGNSVWGGVRLKDILASAGVSDSAVDVILRAADGYSDSIPIDIALDPSTLVAVSQNGQPLTQEHGFPCRLRVPSIYGMKNVKWLREVEVVDTDYKGYWMQRGWSDVATIRTQSRIDVAGRDGVASTGEATWIAGVAWSGGRGISKVEVSTDDGQTWSDALLRSPINRFSWTLWAYEWTPQVTGAASVVCRATDGGGETQTAATAPPHPAGATGYHRVAVSVV